MSNVIKPDKEVIRHAKDMVTTANIMGMMLYKPTMFLVSRSKKKDIKLLNDLVEIFDTVKDFNGAKAIELIDRTINDIPVAHKKYARNYSELAEGLYKIKSFIADIEDGKISSIDINDYCSFTIF